MPSATAAASAKAWTEHQPIATPHIPGKSPNVRAGPSESNAMIGRSRVRPERQEALRLEVLERVRLGKASLRPLRIGVIEAGHHGAGRWRRHERGGAHRRRRIRDRAEIEWPL